jgi:hypothetical protein
MLPCIFFVAIIVGYILVALLGQRRLLGHLWMRREFYSALPRQRSGRGSAAPRSVARQALPRQRSAISVAATSALCRATMHGAAQAFGRARPLGAAKSVSLKKTDRVKFKISFKKMLILKKIERLRVRCEHAALVVLCCAVCVRVTTRDAWDSCRADDDAWDRSGAFSCSVGPTSSATTFELSRLGNFI